VTGRSVLAGVGLTFGVLGLAMFWFPTAALLLAAIAVVAAVPALRHGDARVIAVLAVTLGAGTIVFVAALIVFGSGGSGPVVETLDPLPAPG
jgi:hypothetical protein